MREWILYVGIMVIVFVLFFRDRGLIGALAGLLISGPLYLGLGFVLAKLGYKRATIREIKAQRATSTAESSSSTRPRPAPTRRTSGGTRPRRR